MIKVACAIIENDGKVLCAQRSEKMSLPLKWEFPGGKVEDNENLEDCLKREIKEELGVEMEIIEKLPPNIHAYSNNGSVKLYPFRCREIKGTIKLLEHKKIKWLGLQSLKDLDWAEADIPIVQFYIENYQ